MADFLTDGNPKGGLKKTVEELREFDFEGIEICRLIAFRYSKQLYEIFVNKEDPFFPLLLSQQQVPFGNDKGNHVY